MSEALMSSSNAIHLVVTQSRFSDILSSSSPSSSSSSSSSSVNPHNTTTFRWQRRLSMVEPAFVWINVYKQEVQNISTTSFIGSLKCIWKGDSKQTMVRHISSAF
ncbi:hypothetical protein TcWFU_009349 [Taenia crassiceps]|uniref:Uncharacterized protein n=1 Tax=Taenia crassiceps TaxID=6207 RepID=A0ABR4Q4M2_9CEST